MFDEDTQRLLPRVRASGLRFPIDDGLNAGPANDKETRTRHESAKCMSCYTNAFIFVVSETEGHVSFVRQRQWKRNLRSLDIRHILQQAFVSAQRARVGPEGPLPVWTKFRFTAKESYISLQLNQFPLPDDILAERLTICERLSTKWSKLTFTTDADIAQLFYEISVESATALYKHHAEEEYPTEDPGVNLCFRTDVFERALSERARGRLSPATERILRRARDNVAASDTVDGSKINVFYSSFLSLYCSVEDTVQCELLRFGPRCLGGIVYRFIARLRPFLTEYRTVWEATELFYPNFMQKIEC